ncbi:MAG: cytochrome c3 family protein [Bacillota bacterium]
MSWRSFSRKTVLLVAALVVFIGAATTAVLLQASEKPSFCATCHVIQPYYESWKTGNLLAAKHGEAEIKCLDCHQQSIPEKIHEGVAFVTGNYEKPLKERDFSMADCLACHTEDWEKTVAATNFESSNPHDSHLGEIECHLCHKMHRESQVYCAQCHEFDWFKNLDQSWKVGDIY